MEGQVAFCITRWVKCVCLCVFCSCLSLGAHAEAPKCRVRIAADALSKELLEFGRQCKVEPLLLSVGDELNGIHGNEVIGDFEPAEVLQRILANTGWTFSFKSPDTVSIQPERPATPRALADLLVQRTPFEGGSAVGPPNQSMPPFRLLLTPMDQILVTGTLIRGVDAITSPLLTLVTGQIADTGYAGAQYLVNNALPITSNNTPREDYSPVAGVFDNGVGINLRGLGVGATLVLVDGHRQPLAGLYGSFVDVSTVPSAAIDRIEVIPDGASALYGSDAIAGVVNIKLRHDFVGAETSARYALGQGRGDETVASQVLGSQWDGGHGMLLYQYVDRTSVPIASRSYAANPDKRAQGGNDFRSINANPGNILDPTTYLPAFAIPSGQTGQTLSVAQLLPGEVNLQNQWLGYDLYPQRVTHSVYLTADQDVSSSVRWFVEGRLDRREETQKRQAIAETLIVPATNAFYVDPFGHSPYLPVAYSFWDDLGNTYWTSTSTTAAASIGLKVDIGNGWQSTLSVSDGVDSMRASVHNEIDPTALSLALADSNPATAFNPFGAGSHTPRPTLNNIRALQGERAVSRVPELSVTADGPVFSRNETWAKLALGLGLRQESLQQRMTISDIADGRNTYRREIGSVFGELAVNLPAHIEVSLAGRYEHYSDFGGATNPKVGLRWTPLDSLKFRASWGTSFRAPELPDSDTSRNAAGLVRLPDPRSATGQSLVLYQEGNSPKLHQETAATWTLGFDVALQNMSGLKASLTYYSIDYRDRIAQPGPPNVVNILESESTWREVIQRNPSAASVMAICDGPYFHGSPDDCQSTPPAALIDIRLRNLSRTIAKGIDLDLNQELENQLGVFGWRAQGAYILTFDQQVSDSAPIASVVNTLSYPIKLKARTTVSWRERPAPLAGFELSLAANLQGGYLDNQSIPNRRIDPYSTVDVQFGYSTEAGQEWFDNMEVTLSASNAFNSNPPFVNNELGFDQPDTPPLARLVAISVKKKW